MWSTYQPPTHGATYHAPARAGTTIAQRSKLARSLYTFRRANTGNHSATDVIAAARQRPRSRRLASVRNQPDRTDSAHRNTSQHPQHDAHRRTDQSAKNGCNAHDLQRDGGVTPDQEHRPHDETDHTPTGRRERQRAPPELTKHPTRSRRCQVMTSLGGHPYGRRVGRVRTHAYNVRRRHQATSAPNWRSGAWHRR